MYAVHLEMPIEVITKEKKTKKTGKHEDNSH